MLTDEICYLCNNDCSKYSTLSGDHEDIVMCTKCAEFVINLMRIPNIKCGSCRQLFHKADFEILHRDRKICIYCVKNKKIDVGSCQCCKQKYANFDFAIVNTYTDEKFCMPCMQLFSLLKYDDLVDAVVDTN
jgi:hypothetical protein